jgi:hypothetical protein
MAEPALNRRGVVASDERAAAGVPQHVLVVQLQASAGRGQLDHAGEAGRRERRPVR